MGSGVIDLGIGKGGVIDIGTCGNPSHRFNSPCCVYFTGVVICAYCFDCCGYSILRCLSIERSVSIRGIHFDVIVVCIA